MNTLSEKIIAQIQKIQDPLYCTLSTVDSEGMPWGGVLYFGYDTGAHFFWTSSPESQHSKNIKQNKNAYITLFQENLQEGTGDTCGLYMRGTVEELSTIEEVLYAKTVTAARLRKTPVDPSLFMGNSPRKVYRFIPSEAWVNDSVVQIGDSGYEYKVNMRIAL